MKKIILYILVAICLLGVTFICYNVGRSILDIDYVANRSTLLAVSAISIVVSIIGTIISASGYEVARKRIQFNSESVGLMLLVILILLIVIGGMSIINAHY
jgi:hypothetical protein